MLEQNVYLLLTQNLHPLLHAHNITRTFSFHLFVSPLILGVNLGETTDLETVPVQYCLFYFQGSLRDLRLVFNRNHTWYVRPSQCKQEVKAFSGKCYHRFCSPSVFNR